MCNDEIRGMKSKEEEEVARHQQWMREIWKEEEEEVARHQQRMREIQREKEVAQEGYGPISSVGCSGSGAEEVPGEAETDPGCPMTPMTAIQESHCCGRVEGEETRGTQISNLPDECLIHILRCLNTSDSLPLRVGEEVDVYHPLQCAIVCKRWHALADTAVSNIWLPFRNSGLTVDSQQLAFPFKHHTTLSISAQKLVGSFEDPTALSLSAQQLVGRFKHLTALSLSGNVKDRLPLAESTPQLEYLKLKRDLYFASDHYRDFECPVPAMVEAFARWSNLRRLKLGRYLDLIAEEEIENLLETVGTLQGLRHLSFSYLRDNLVAVCTRVGQMSGLTTVDLSSYRFPAAEGRFCEVLRKLKVHCEEHEIPDQFGLFPNLESFSVIGAQDLTALLGQLSSLKKLEVTRVTTWPESYYNSLPALRTLILRSSYIPDCFCKLTRLEIYGGCVPSRSIFSTCDFGNLRVLHLEGCDPLSACLDGLGMIGGLRELHLVRYDTSQALPESLGLLTNLEVCAIEKFSRLRLLPEAVGSWLKLTRLEVQCCHVLQALPEVLGQIPLLKELKVVGCPSLVSLRSAAGCFSSLEVLDLSDCEELTWLPDAMEGLGSLRRLVMWGCGDLEVPECLWQRSGLRIDDRRRKSCVCQTRKPSMEEENGDEGALFSSSGAEEDPSDAESDQW